jgi:hypothetical protein
LIWDWLSGTIEDKSQEIPLDFKISLVAGPDLSAVASADAVSLTTKVLPFNDLGFQKVVDKDPNL